MKFKKYEIFLITGGTGGHIVPAINFYDYLKKNNIASLIITDKRGLKYFDNKKYNHKIIFSSHLKKNNLAFIYAILSLVIGFFQFTTLLIRLKPKNIITFGSYVSFSPLLSSFIFKKIFNIKIYLHEQNSVFGKVHKIFSFIADKIFVTYKNTLGVKKKYKIIFSGFPTNPNLIKYQKKCVNYDPKIKNFNLLVFGGSQGAVNLSRKVVKLLNKLPISTQKLIYLTIQVPAIDLENIKLELEKTKIKYEINSFFHDIIKRLSKVDLCICRAGSSTINELNILKIPSILIPLPSASDNHQYYNANFLSQSGGAIIIEESNLLSKNTLSILNDLIYNTEILKKMFLNLKKIKQINSSNLLFNEIFNKY